MRGAGFIREPRRRTCEAADPRARFERQAGSLRTRPVSPMTTIDIATLRERVGQEIAVSGWLDVTQARIDRFADATDDHQWIHVDAARAEKESPFKTTIA